MPSTRPRDLLTDALLGQLQGTDLPGTAPAGGESPGGQADAGALARDLELLRQAGYLSVALPVALGGLDCTLRQAACGQRRLAGVAPYTALAVSAHLYWTAAACDALRSGDDSMAWMLAEAARGAIFGAGHTAPGGDLKFAAPDSRCVPDGAGGYEFRDPRALASVTPGWDWLAIHALTDRALADDALAGDALSRDALARDALAGGVAASAPSRLPRRDAVLAFAWRGTRCTPTASPRVARVLVTGAPSDVFTTSAIGWGCALLASVEFAAARRAFRQAVAAAAAQHPGAAGVPGPGQRATSHPLDRWPVAEASLRLDTMKARIAWVTHPWPRVPVPGPDLSGQHLISVYAMRREIIEGAGEVRRLTSAITATHPASGPAIATPRR